MSDFDPLPSGDPPVLDAVAAAIGAGFPADARGRAAAMLRDQILPWRLRSLATHPRPRRLAEVVYEDVTERLRAVPAAGRLVALEAVAFETAAERQVGEATSLAVARYLIDHPKACGGEPWRTDAARWLSLTAAQREAEAGVRRTELDALVTAAPPACSRAIRQKVIHARMALGSARSGSFATAAGMLLDFLRSVGEQPQELDVH